MHIPNSDDEYDAWMNDLATLISQVTMAPNGQVLAAILNHIQTIYVIEKARRAQVAEIQDRLAKIEKMVQDLELEGDNEDFD